MAQAITPEIQNITQLTDYLSTLKQEAESHLGSLETMIGKGNDAAYDASIEENQKNINEKIGILIASVEGNSVLKEALHSTDTDATIFYNQVKAQYESGSLAGKFETAQTQNQENMTRKDRITSFSGDNKRAVGAGAVGFGRGFTQGYNESTPKEEMESSGRWSRQWKRFKGVCNGTRKGLLYGVGGFLGIKAIDLGIKAMSGVKDAIDFATSPSARYAAAKSGIGSLVDTLKGWLGSFGITSHDEQSDPANAEVAAQRMDEGIYEISMEDVHNVSLFNRKTNQAEKILIPEAIEVPEAMQAPMLDEEYSDPSFTEKYLVTIKTLNLWTQTARARSQESSWWTKQGLYYNDIFILEQDILALQNMVRTGKSKQEIDTYINGLLERVTTFEKSKQSVIGPSDWAKVTPYISTIQAEGGADYNKRQEHRDEVIANIYNEFTSIGGYGNNNLTAKALYEELIQSESYIGVLNFFEDTTLFNDLENIPEGSTFDEALMKKIAIHFKNLGFHDKGISSIAERDICEQLIKNYHASKKSSEDPKTHDQIKRHFNRNFGGNIDTDIGAQQRMVQSYESDPQMLENIKLFAKDQNYPGSMTETDPKRIQIIKDFARTSAKKQIIVGSLQSGFLEGFFDHYLGSKQKKTRQEAVLADIIGAGSDVSYNTIRGAVDIGINIAISLIPLAGAEFAIARTIAALGARYAVVQSASVVGWTARVALRTIVGHTVMSVGQGVISNKGLYEMFDNFVDWREFGKNALFFNVIGRLAPWMKSQGQVLKGITPADRIGKNLLPVLNNGMFQNIFALGTEAAVVTGGGAFLDPDHDWSRGEFMTVSILSLMLQSKVGSKIRDYKAVIEKGKVKIIPRNIARIAQGVESGVTKNSGSLRTRYRNNLKNMKEGEQILCNEQQIIRTNNGRTSGDKVFKTVDEALTHIHLKAVAAENIPALRAQELGTGIEKVIGSNKVLKIGEHQYRFTLNNGTAGLTKFVNGKRTQVSEQELLQLNQKNEKLLLEKLGKKVETLTQTQVSSLPAAEQSWLKKKLQKVNPKSDNNLLIGDIYPILRDKKFNFWDIAKGNGSIGKGIASPFHILQGGIQATKLRIPTGLSNIGKGLGNAQSAFSVYSIFYGAFVGDDGDTGFDEGMENYLLYTVLGRSLPLKALAYIFDENVL